MKNKLLAFIVLIVISVNKTTAQRYTYPNIGFEDGTFSGWTLLNGTATDNGIINTTILSKNASNLPVGRNQVITYWVNGNIPVPFPPPVSIKPRNYDQNAPDSSPFPIPVICPLNGGKYSIRLGDTSSGGRAYGIQRNIAIPPGAKNFNIVYYYSTFLNNPLHSECEMPRFWVRVLDSATQTLILSASRDFNTTSILRDSFLVSQFWHQSIVSQGIYYCDWMPASILADSMAGRTITIQFAGIGCTLGAHEGYCYIDMDTSFTQYNIDSTVLSDPNGYKIALTLPPGYKEYRVYNQTNNSLIATSKAKNKFDISPAPAIGTKLKIACIPFKGFGKVDSTTRTVVGYVPKKLSVIDTACDFYSMGNRTFYSDTTVQDTLRTTNSLDSIYLTRKVKILPSPTLNTTIKQVDVLLGDTLTIPFQSTNYISTLTFSGDSLNSIYSFPTSSSIKIPMSALWNGKINVVGKGYGCSSNTLQLKIRVLANIAGNIVTSTGKSILNVNVKVNGDSTFSLNAKNAKYTTNLEVNKSYILDATKTINGLRTNGINVVDIALMQSHILGTKLLSTPYSQIAADVNGDGKISSLDLVFVRRFILGVDSLFPQNKLWRFLDSSKQVNLSNYISAQSLTLNKLANHNRNSSLIGIRIGDVNNDWNATVGKSSIPQKVELNYSNIKTDDQSILSKISVQNDKYVSALQFVLKYDQLKYAVKNINTCLQGTMYKVDEQLGEISFIWNEPNNKAVAVSEFCSVVFKPNTTTNFPCNLSLISNENKECIALLNDFTPIPLVLKAKEHFVIKYDLVLQPNPTKDMVSVQFNSLKKEVAYIQIVDIEGKILYKKPIQINSGKNNISLRLQSEAHLSKGIYFLQIPNGLYNSAKLYID